MAADLVDLASALACEAGALLVARFQRPPAEVATKSSGTDMVTDADRAAEELILSRLARERPDDAVLGEEGGRTDGTSGLRWVVDPLDGTTNFLFGIPQWAVSIACEDGEGGLAGVIFDPVRDELFAARRGGGATLNGSPIRVSDATDLSRALVATGFSYLPEERAAEARALVEIVDRVRDVRRAGAASLDLAWTACGRLDGYYETPIERWDVAAGEVLVREAGGCVAGLPGLGRGGAGVLAAGPGIFDELRALVEESLAARPESPA